MENVFIGCLVWTIFFPGFFVGWILIDRCGKHFGTILNFLRDGSVSLPESSREIAELQAEAKYYLIEELAESCVKALQKKERGEHEPICMVSHLKTIKLKNLDCCSENPF